MTGTVHSFDESAKRGVIVAGDKMYSLDWSDFRGGKLFRLWPVRGEKVQFKPVDAPQTAPAAPLSGFRLRSDAVASLKMSGRAIDVRRLRDLLPEPAPKPAPQGIPVTQLDMAEAIARTQAKRRAKALDWVEEEQIREARSVAAQERLQKRLAATRKSNAVGSAQRKAEREQTAGQRERRRQVPKIWYLESAL